jgi:transcriptional regulator with XRE-family HTH domain
MLGCKALIAPAKVSAFMPSRLLNRLIDRVRELREQRGLTQEAFAEEAQISYKYYQAIEAGRKVDLRLSTLERLARAHGLDVWELLLPQPSGTAVGEAPAKYRKTPAARKARKKK